MTLKKWGTRSIYKSNRSAFGGPSDPRDDRHHHIDGRTGQFDEPKQILKAQYAISHLGSAAHDRVSPAFGYPQQDIKNWIRFCVAFVHNSARFRTPVADDEIFEMLFMYVVKDRFLRDFYRLRRIDVATEQSTCCDGCASGGGCAANSRLSNVYSLSYVSKEQSVIEISCVQSVSYAGA